MKTKKKRGPRGPLSAKHLAWYASERLKEIGRRGIAKINAEVHLRPRCGARRRKDGEPCRNLPMANGRCRFHGGATPSGDDWHRVQWPNGRSPSAEKRLQSKLAALARRDGKRKKRVASMDEGERAQHDKRRRELKPGTAAGREMRRKLKADATFLAALAGRPDTDLSPETQRLREELAALEARAEALRSAVEEAQADRSRPAPAADDEFVDMGIFG